MTRDLITIFPMETVGRAASLMAEFRIGSLPVLEGEKLVGIITSRDIRGVAPDLPVVEVMTKNVITVPSNCSLWDAKEKMERHKIERLVVVDGGSCVGIVTKLALYWELGKHIDSLTGLMRAEYLQRKAYELVQQGKEIAVIFLDIDNFGEIDKKLGHVVGDAILKKVAHVFKRMVEKKLDYLCRYAGDEFAVVTERNFEEASKLAWDMVLALEREKWEYDVEITASAGLAGGRRRAVRRENRISHSVADLINMASLASTAAKKRGDKVVVAESHSLKAHN
ncbi:MAG: CBS domain-containing protein [Clostridia bacterium]|nr:CBS domain-containing protein [Clostridia bacterium]